MSNVTSELINLFTFLLPGFITSFLFYSLRASPKKSEIEMVVMALIYTTVINLIVRLFNRFFIWVGIKFVPIGQWSHGITILWSFVLAILLGLLLTFLYNNDILHKILRKKLPLIRKSITNEHSYPTEWYGVFSETQLDVVLHFNDGRRLMGWPEYWPKSPESGHFVLQEASVLSYSHGNIIYAILKP